jgi:hypothetical protein
MMEELLDAECVINHLYNQKIISPADWQNQHPNDQAYSIYFDHHDAVGIIALHIIKRAGKYYIPRSLIAILSARYRFNAEGIYSECIVKSPT